MEFFYAGLRPLVSDGSKDSYNVSRRAELVDHGKEGSLDGLFSALGGKYTTSRDLAEKVTDALVAKLGRKAACLRHRNDARCPAAASTVSTTCCAAIRKPGPGFPPCAIWPICWARGCRWR